MFNPFIWTGAVLAYNLRIPYPYSLNHFCCCLIQGKCYVNVKKVKVKSLSRVRLFATPWTVAYKALPSMGFSRQEYWSGLPFPSPGDLPDPGIEPGSPALQADALPSEPPGNIVIKPQIWLTQITLFLLEAWRTLSDNTVESLYFPYKPTAVVKISEK